MRDPRCGLVAALLAIPMVLGAQGIALEVRPRPGDTLFIALEHRVTLTGGPRGLPDSTTTISSSYRVLTRDIVERADPAGTTVLAIVDSVRMRTTGSIGASPFPGVDRGMEGVQMRLRVARSGASEIITGLQQIDPELQALLGAMPAVLPTKAVTVGEAWTRDLPRPRPWRGPSGPSSPSIPSPPMAISRGSRSEGGSSSHGPRRVRRRPRCSNCRGASRGRSSSIVGADGSPSPGRALRWSRW